MELITSDWAAYQLTWLGEWADRFGNLAEAEEWYLAAVATGESNGYPEYSLGWIAERASRIEDAESWYRRGAQIGHYNSVIALAQLAKDSRNWDESIKWFLIAIAMGKSDGSEEGWLGWLLDRVDQPEASRYWFLKAAEHNDAAAFTGLGYYAWDAGDIDAAEKWFLEAISKGVSDGSEQYALAQLADECGRSSVAVLFWLWLSAMRGNYEATLELAQRSSMRGDSEEAEYWHKTLIMAHVSALLTVYATGDSSRFKSDKFADEEIIAKAAKSWIPSQNPEPQPPDYSYLIKLLEKIVGPIVITEADCEAMIAACPGCRTVCRSESGICAKHYGDGPVNGTAVEVGEPVGSAAVRAISEAVAKLAAASGAESGPIDSLSRIVEIFEARTPRDDAILAEHAGTITIVHDGERRAIVLTPKKGGDETITYRLKPGTNLIPGIEDGSGVKAGAQLTEGQIDPKKILRILGQRATVRFLVDELQSVFKSHGVDVAGQHLELVAREMLQWIKVIDPRESGMPRGVIVSQHMFKKENRDATVNGLRAATGRRQLLGITRTTIEKFKSI